MRPGGWWLKDARREVSTADRRRLVAFGILVAIIDGAAYLGWLPALCSTLPGTDTVAHFLLLGALGLLADRALGRRYLVGVVPLGPALVAVLASLGEAAQVISPLRSVSLGDFLANLAGIVTFWALDAGAQGRPELPPARAEGKGRRAGGATMVGRCRSPVSSCWCRHRATATRPSRRRRPSSAWSS